MRSILTVMALGLLGCNSGSVTGPSEPIQAPIAPLPVPTTLRGVWGESSGILARVAAYQGNVGLLIIDTWGEDIAPVAGMMRERGIGAIPYVEQCFTQSRGAWDVCWARVETWAKPLKDAGILWGFHVMDEPSKSPETARIRDEANAYVRARGYDVFATEVIDAVTDQNKRALPRPPGVRWYGVTCYDYGGPPQAKWRIENCAEEYARHRDWDTVIGQGFDAGNGMPSRARWEAIASGRGIVWWVDAD